MNRDADRKQSLLAGWWGELLPRHAVRILDRGEVLDKQVAFDRLERMPGGCPAGQSLYVLFVETGAEFIPVYIGKADAPLTRWAQHLDGWLTGTGTYARWRGLLDDEGRVRETLTLLIVPAAAITRPPIPNFPTTVGAAEYQLVGLAADAYPGRLLNHEGVGR